MMMLATASEIRSTKNSTFVTKALFVALLHDSRPCRACTHTSTVHSSALTSNVHVKVLL
jgi:hypothetical protein